MIDFIDFIKKYTTINEKFIDDFYEIFNNNINIYNNSFIINSNKLIKWLNIKQKENLLKL